MKKVEREGVSRYKLTVIGAFILLAISSYAVRNPLFVH